MANAPHNPVVDIIEPSSAWTEDSNGHYLEVDIPGIYTKSSPSLFYMVLQYLDYFPFNFLFAPLIWFSFPPI